MNYKGYTARYAWDPDEQVLHGRIDGIEDIVTFVGENMTDLEREFRISVDHYLDWCARDGVEPQRPATTQRRAS